MTSKDIALISGALADVERMIEEIPDPQGIGASTLRIVIDSIAGAIKAEKPRFKPAHFQADSMPIAHERLKQAILKSLAKDGEQ